MDANDRQRPRATGPGPVRDRPLEHRVARVDYDAELRLHDEVLDLQGEVRNFTSLLRVVCAVYLGRTVREAKVPATLSLGAVSAFA